jgi:hypothetical protein
LATVRQNDGSFFLCKTGVQFIPAKKNSRSYGTGFLEIRRGAMTTDLRMVVFVFAVAMGIHCASKV